MTTQNPKSEIGNSKPSPWQTPGLSHYYVVCLVSMGLIWLMLLRRDLPTSVTLFPVLVGLLGIAVRWRLAPVILLATLAVCLKFEYTPSTPEALRTFRVSDMILCAATLTYVAGQYRLQGMLDHIAPMDPRRREGAPRWHVGLLSIRYQPEVVREKRAPSLVTREEIGMLILGSALWAGLAQIIWNLLPLEKSHPQIFPLTVWRAIVLAWILAAVLYVLFGLLSYLSQRAMTGEEATLFLQDVLWKETRGEQRRLNRWSAWSRLRRRENNR